MSQSRVIPFIAKSEQTIDREKWTDPVGRGTMEKHEFGMLSPSYPSVKYIFY
jgi:hypothetical protein